MVVTVISVVHVLGVLNVMRPGIDINCREILELKQQDAAKERI